MKWNSQSECGYLVQHYLGYTEIKYPNVISTEDTDIDYKEIYSVGLSVGDLGANIGYLSHKKILFNNGNSLYVNVRTKEQFEYLIDFLKQYKEGKIWVSQKN